MKSAWKHVREELPPKDERVLWLGPKGGMFIGDYIGYTRIDPGYVYVHVPNSRCGRMGIGRMGIYWTPLPDPPTKS